jgi:hypothetical protein
VTDFVYIMSPSYSGSTLLTFLLATHPRIATIGELKATNMGDVEKYTCSCGEFIRACGFWRTVGETLQRRGIPFDVGDFGTHFRCKSSATADHLLRARVRGPLFETVRSLGTAGWPGCRRARARILERNLALIETIRQIQGADVFLDGSKDPVRLKHLLAAPLGAVKVIHLIRDGRGTANSYTKHYGTTMDVAAVEWRQAQEECERMAGVLPPGACLSILYEDLCRRPDETLTRVFGFLDLEASAARRDFLAMEHHILGNPMRLRSTGQIVLDEKWRAELTEDSLACFDRVAGKLNRRLGYR